MQTSRCDGTPTKMHLFSMQSGRFMTFWVVGVNWKHFNYLCCSLISHERHHSGWIRLTRPFHLFWFGTPLGVQSLGLFWIAGATFQAFLKPDITDIRTCFQGCEERSPVRDQKTPIHFRLCLEGYSVYGSAVAISR